MTQLNQAGIEDKPNIVYFRSDHSNTLRCTGKIAEQIDVSWTTPSTWGELSEALQIDNAYLAVHVDMLTNPPVGSAIEFMDALSVITKFMPCHGKLQVGIVIKSTTPISVVRDLQKTHCQGILLDIDGYSINEVNKALNALTNGIPYWPKCILDKLPLDKPLSIYFREDWEDYKTKFNSNSLTNTLDFAFCKTWNELDTALAKHPHQLIFHVSLLDRLDSTIPEIMSMLETRLKMAGLTIPIGVGIEPNTKFKTIKELKRAGVHCIVPSAQVWGIGETNAALQSLHDRIPNWPKHIIDQLPGAVKKVKPTSNGVRLTARQEQVFTYITERGASNKVIAKALGLSESTVKLHVTEIFKKYGVKSRTQLAVFSHTS